MPSGWRRIYAVTVPSTTSPASAPVIGSKVRLCGWSLRDLGNQPTVQALDVAVAAAAAGTLTLTGFLTVSLVRVTPAAAWPAGVNQVTLTNVAGGTQTVDIEGGTANAAELLFPVPLPTTGTPVVSVPAIVGGPAFTIEAVGTIAAVSSPETSAIGVLMDGGQIIGEVVPFPGRADNEWLSDDGVYVGTGIALNVIAGTLGGCLYVFDDIEPGGT